MRLNPILLLPVLIGASALAAAPPKSAAPPPPPPPTTAQLVAARQAGMHMAATLLNHGVKAAIESGRDVKDLAAEADGIAMWAAAIPGLFPPGSGHPQSRASSAIWADKADFDRKASDLRTAASRLAALAEAGDRTGFAAQAPAVQAACAACHKAYRTD